MSVCTIEYKESLDLGKYKMLEFTLHVIVFN